MGDGPDLTALLQAWSQGDGEALEQLAPLVHRELRLMARRILATEPRPAPWQATDLVHECFLRLLDWRAVPWQNRAHFFGTTARMMRRALVDAARARAAAKRGAGASHAPIDPDELAAPEREVDLIALDRALESLAASSPRPSQVVELRYFGGFTVEETAEALGVSVRTVINDWNTARVWLHRQLSPQQAGDR
jgi:RNA polymerase sigma-70 factor (ECF subfamily)